MRKILFSVIAVAITFFAVVSCDDNEFTEKDALNNDLELIAFKDSLMKDSLRFLRDSLKNYGVIEYSVKVFNASENGSAKSGNDAGTAGITVFLAQHGKIDTAETDASGMVVFEDLRIGTANVTVTSTEYTDVSYIADITPSGASFNGNNDYHVASQIAVFDLDAGLATLKGKITIDTDLVNNKMPENAVGVDVIASIDVAAEGFKHYYMESGSGTSYTGDILEISYTNVMTTVPTDDNGLYSIDVPSTPDGIPYKVTVSDFVTDQALLLKQRYGHDVFGVQNVRTIFGENATPSSIPTVAPAYVEISAPTGNANHQPTTVATASAVVTKSGVEAIHITATGDGYTQLPNVVINSSANGEGATATATMDAQGRINDIVVTTPGIGYTAATTSVAIEESAEHAELSAVLEYGVTDITVSNKGTGYTSTPAVSIHGDGTGATAQAIMTGVVDNFTVTNGGSNYTQTPDVLVTGGGGSGAKAVATLSQRGPIANVNITSAAATYPHYAGGQSITVDFNSTFGTGAAGTGVLAAEGRVQSITVTNSGSGYTSIPAVSISGGNGSGALAVAIMDVVNTDEVASIIIYTDGGGTTHYGSGYTSAPTIQIEAAPTGGTNATATAELYFPLESINVTSAGTEYDNATTIALNPVPDAGTFTGSVVINKTVESIAIQGVNNGTGYTTAPAVQIITKDGDTGTGATATAALTQIVDDIEVLTPGQGYVSGNTLVSIDAAPAGGTNAVASVTGYEGTITSVDIIDGGTGYTAAPHITLTGGGSGVDFVPAEISLTISGGSVTAVTVDDPGAQYTSAPTISLSTYQAAASASVEVNPDAGQIEQINVTLAGEGYTVAPTVEIDDLNGVASGASATAEISNGSVVNIVVNNGGTGYYKAPAIKLTVPNYATGATAYIEVNEQGVITKITVDEKGMGYETEPTVTVLPAVAGMGTGAAGEAVIVNGQVSEIRLTNGGTGYLGQNTPGLLGTQANINTSTFGKGFKIFNPQGYDFVSGKTYVFDMYLGTGERVEEY